MAADGVLSFRYNSFRYKPKSFRYKHEVDSIQPKTLDLSTELLR